MALVVQVPLVLVHFGGARPYYPMNIERDHGSMVHYSEKRIPYIPYVTYGKTIMYALNLGELIIYPPVL